MKGEYISALKYIESVFDMPWIYVRCLKSVWIEIKQIEDQTAQQPLPSQTKFIQAAFSLLLYYYDVKINVKKNEKVNMKMIADLCVTY